MLTNKIVEMHMAYVWDCDQCGTENFVRAIVHEFTPADAEELRDQGIEDAETGNWVTAPEQVKCKCCGAEFEARHFRAGDDSFITQDPE